jgi:3-dehydroquinate synthase
MSDQSSYSAIEIRSSSHTYSVEIGSSLLSNVSLDSKRFVICDERFSSQMQLLGMTNLVSVVAQESNKNLGTVERVILELQALGLVRGGLVSAIGGGIIQDIATLAASLFMRGVEWEYFPSTLLGMADSCIGGKSSINAGDIKNLVGNIYPPKKILIDTDFAESLSVADYNSGLSEAVKICYCKGSEEFYKFLELVGDDSQAKLVDVLLHVLSTKKWFIEIDEFDQRERQLLNFGHTFGHALEVSVGHAVPHGLAVAIGMSAAINFESTSRRTSPIELELQSYIEILLSSAQLLNSLINIVDWTAFERAFNGDKKHTNEKYRLVLPNPGGGVRIETMDRNLESMNRVKVAMKTAMERMLL